MWPLQWFRRTFCDQPNTLKRIQIVSVSSWSSMFYSRYISSVNNSASQIILPLLLWLLQEAWKYVVTWVTLADCFCLRLPMCVCVWRFLTRGMPHLTGTMAAPRATIKVMVQIYTVRFTFIAKAYDCINNTWNTICFVFLLNVIQTVGFWMVNIFI